MSEYFFLKCLSCNIESESRINHLDNILLIMLNMADCFKKLKELDKDNFIIIDILGNEGTDFVDFLANHHSHNVVVYSEYGRYITKDGILHK